MKAADSAAWSSAFSAPLDSNGCAVQFTAATDQCNHFVSATCDWPPVTIDAVR